MVFKDTTEGNAMNYYISDLHIGHENILRFDNRPFADVNEMNNKLIENWNARVRSDDTVYILGDFIWAKESEWPSIVGSLGGNKVLIRGNHDPKQFSAVTKRMFQEITDLKEIKDSGKHVVMCHYPIPFFRASFASTAFMLYGHVHQTIEYEYIAKLRREVKANSTGYGTPNGNFINVGCMMPYMDYTPRTLDEIVGQQHILGRDKMLYRAIKADKLSSIILYGPPGTGKTTIAKVIANTTSAAFTQINATVAGKKDMEQVVQEAKDRMGMYGKRTILFVDEIHRFNKGQQDYLLPFVEDGTLILIGATTENPYFEVNGALISRSVIFELKPLSAEDIGVLIRRAVYDTERGMGSYGAEISDDAVDFLADISGGDARMALNAVELGVLTTEPSADGKIHITVDVASECIQRRVMRYDKNGDNHYDTISAFIKSMRGSDPDAAIYYLARMLYAGEEPAFIARRIMICASEDVGNADPQALQVAVAASQAVERLGMPEARITLAQAAAYVACAPKSNAAIMAIDEAMALVRSTQAAPVPPYLQDAHYGGAAKLGHGIGYKYAHDYPNHYVRQQYLPDAFKDQKFYHMGDLGYEKEMKEHMRRIRGDESNEE